MQLDTQTPIVVRAPAWFGPFGLRLAAIRRAVRDRRLRRRAFRDLYELDDHLLDDIGLYRDQLRTPSILTRSRD